MLFKVPAKLSCSAFFNGKGEAVKGAFSYSLRDALQYDANKHIPLTQTPYMIFGDIGIPCNSPSFSKHFEVCNKTFIALHKLSLAYSVSSDIERADAFRECASLFEELPEFPWPVPEKAVFPMFCDCRAKIASALQAVSIFYAEENKTKVSKLDEVIVLNEAAGEFKFFNSESLSDVKYELLATRACNEANMHFQQCQKEPTPANVEGFVQNGASAVFLREKIKTPGKELLERIDKILETLQKYHLEAYENFLATLRQSN